MSVQNTLVLAVLLTIAVIPLSSASYDDANDTTEVTQFDPGTMDSIEEPMVQNYRRLLKIVPNKLYFCRRNRAGRRRCHRVISLGRIKIRRPIKPGTCHNLVQRRRNAFGVVTVRRVGQLCRFKPKMPAGVPLVLDSTPAFAPSPSDLENLVPPVEVDLTLESAPLPGDLESVLPPVEANLPPESSPTDDLAGLLFSPAAEPFPA
ncbi:hypothetical protein RND81_06G140900 [Saponaria officinalis]|uniref:Uncharacterized protein n=1 Tax=Saponaria officinalis TaxID=3572 RepID=A0AAW1KBB7_SAPOF